MRFLKSILLFFYFLVFLAGGCFAYSVPDDTIVYVTPNGTKYHREDCTHTGTVTSMTIAQAERQGYGPCSRCNPDILTGKYVSTWDEESPGSSNAESNPGSFSGTVKGSAQPKNLWYSSPFVAILVVAVGGTLTKAGIALYGAFRRHKYKSRQKYLESLRQQAKSESEQLEYQEKLERQKQLQQQAFEEEQRKYAELYSGKPAEILAGIPQGVEIGPDGLPKVSGTDGWGAAFTFYIAPSGRSFHRTRGCSSAYTAAHAVQVSCYGYVPCKRCQPQFPDLSWFTKYKQIVSIKARYHID